jgi:Tol biopolymer transport system component
MARLGFLLAAIGLAAGCAKVEDPRPSKIAFAIDRSGTNRDILVMDAKGGEPQAVAPAESFDQDPAWSPDGATLIFTSGRDGHYGIYSWEGKLGKIAMAHYQDLAPAWSPDGRRIAFMSDRDEDYWQIYSIGSTGKDEKRLTNSKSNDTWPVWTVDGGSILFLSDRGGQQDIYSVKVLPGEKDPSPKKDEGKEAPRYTEDPRPLTNDRAWDGRPSCSPDGKWIAWPSAREGKAAIFVMGVDGKNARRLTPLDSDADEPSWSPDGRTIVFVSTRDGFRELYVMAADGSGQRRLTFQRGQIHTPAWSPFLPATK